ncbi:hypothetical protein CDD81_7873 [Ophiocordyceps australis]|uniref:Glycosyl hydrolase n=1 Tax=Ophiocordyceps australis TaxID=1399860 RepID=A0A2C5YFL9_9HYPO|nr:hypothetical protein CDD81_7873 [Ophiocordyceps australis]
MARWFLSLVLLGLVLFQTAWAAQSPPDKLKLLRFPPWKILRFPPWKLLRFPPGKLDKPPSAQLVRFPRGKSSPYCPVYAKDSESAQNCTKFPTDWSGKEDVNLAVRSDKASLALQDVFTALSNLQNNYFDNINGTWPSSIDWTGAVVETIVSGTLSTLTQSLATSSLGSDEGWKQKENLVSSIYAQVVHSFFGQNALAIKDQAYDDMLWVVLGWIEAIKFVRLHAKLHYPGTEHDCQHMPNDLDTALQTMPWQGYNFVCSFADRARAFWDFASSGWDTTLCHGGMLWNPRLAPYKNAITNELWIAGSVSMYQFFPNDTFNASWAESKGFPGNNPVYLAAGIEGYRWLKNVNMTNSMGLYVDGYHIDMKKPGNVECDVRDEMVYTYNQAVLLTGQRGLWALTGSPSYLAEGHELIRAAIAATGWDLVTNKPIDDAAEDGLPQKLPPWRGLGRGGILEDQCDVDGSCSQDAQAFKGILMHHLASFCAPVEPFEETAGVIIDSDALQHVQQAHAISCRSYVGWIEHNVLAALATRDELGLFGMWWGAALFGALAPPQVEMQAVVAAGADNVTDYRNQGTPQNEQWGLNSRFIPGQQSPKMGCMHLEGEAGRENRLPSETGKTGKTRRQTDQQGAKDPNSRGRGRSVETQAGGLALLRAYYELLR